jgi:hypothetical protein
MPFTRNILFGLTAGCAASACGGVAESDPSFWQPSKDVGGIQVQFAPGAAQPPGSPGAGGQGQQLPPGSPGAGGQAFQQPQPAGAGGGSPFTGGGGSTAAGGFFGGAGSPPAGAGGTITTPAPPPPPPPGTNSGACTLTFSVTTVTARGQYAPRNVGAIWISNATGQYVKSLDVWGSQRLGNVTAWQTASGGDKTDAITSATHASHGPHNVTWNCLDRARNPVPDDQYTVNVSFIEGNAIPFFGPAPIIVSVPFAKGSAPVDITPPDAPNFVGMHLSYHSP